MEFEGGLFRFLDFEDVIRWRMTIWPDGRNLTYAFDIARPSFACWIATHGSLCLPPCDVAEHRRLAYWSASRAAASRNHEGVVPIFIGRGAPFPYEARGINPGTPVSTTGLKRTLFVTPSRISCMASSGKAEISKFSRM